MRPRTVQFRAYKGDALILHTWALEGSAADMERSVYQTRLDRGDFSRVDVTDPEFVTSEMYALGKNNDNKA